MKKRLLISSDSFFPRRDGVAVFLNNIIPFLAKKFEITLVVPKFKGNLPDLPATIIQFPLRAHIADIPFTGWHYKEILTLVKQHDVIFNNTIGPIGLATVRAARKTRTPLISFVHSIEWELLAYSVDKFKFLLEFLAKRYARYMYKRVKKIVFPSNEVKKLFSKLKIKQPNEIIEVKIPLNQFTPKKTRSKKITIGYCGRISREKGIDVLIKSFKELKKKYSNIDLLIVGTGISSLTRKAKRAGIKITGKVSNPQDYYKKMDIFVLPSLTETTSLAVMEAMTSALPIVTTSIARFPEFINKSKAGILIEPDNEEELTNALSIFINNKQLRNTCSKNARKYALKNFDIKDSAKKLIKTINSM